MHFGKNCAWTRSLQSVPGERVTLNPEGLVAVPLGRKEKQIQAYYRILFSTWGCQHWWPARTRFEVIVGAYLTQNTAWTNVESALSNLRSARLLTLEGIRQVALPELERLIHCAGYFRQKARRLKTFIAFLDQHHGGSLSKLFSQPTPKLRQQLLSLNGVGRETADSILLYAGNYPVFVVDAYTRRILDRHGILPEKIDYEDIRQLFERALNPLAAEALTAKSGEPGSAHRPSVGGAGHPPSRMSTSRRTTVAQVYNEMHGLIVGVGKNYCRKSQAKCDECPLRSFLPHG
jgi:endonuclease III related protein